MEPDQLTRAVSRMSIRRRERQAAAPQVDGAVEPGQEAWNRWADKIREERNAELVAMHRRGAYAKRVPKQEHDLFLYLMYRAVEGRSIEGDSFDRLRAANHVVNETREELDLGRGNVIDDIEDTRGASSRHVKVAYELRREVEDRLNRLLLKANAGKALSEPDKRLTETLKSGDAKRLTEVHLEQLRAVCATKLEAGHCRDFAAVAATIGRLRHPRWPPLHQVNSSKCDHGWTEVRLDSPHPSREDVIIDPWGYGPAVLREDSYFAWPSDRHVPKGVDPLGLVPRYVTSRRALTSEDVPQIALLMEALEDYVASPDIERFVEGRLEVHKNYALPRGSLFGASRVESEEFVARAESRFGALGSDARGRMLRLVIAAGVSRQLGTNVKQAAREAEMWFQRQ
ncbi:hypothetical protein [Trinickia sp.]|uniref:hypothetical protein n=1 Tax=Trinickia sp. TaxID=2571163 RepID=UPI003F7D2B57